jgi:chromosome segregation ATPase
MLRSLVQELAQVTKDQRSLLTACQQQNVILQNQSIVQKLETATQTSLTSAALQSQIDDMVEERSILGQTVSDLRGQLLQLQRDSSRESDQQRIMQLNKELVAMRDKASLDAREYQNQIQRLQEQDARRELALRQANDSVADFELKNAILHELVEQLEISKARLEADKQASAERYHSLRTVLSAVEERAIQAEMQHAILVQGIGRELQEVSRHSSLS